MNRRTGDGREQARCIFPTKAFSIPLKSSLVILHLTTPTDFSSLNELFSNLLLSSWSVSSCCGLYQALGPSDSSVDSSDRTDICSTLSNNRFISAIDVCAVISFSELADGNTSPSPNSVWGMSCAYHGTSGKTAAKIYLNLCEGVLKWLASHPSFHDVG